MVQGTDQPSRVFGALVPTCSGTWCEFQGKIVARSYLIEEVQTNEARAGHSYPLQPPGSIDKCMICGKKADLTACTVCKVTKSVLGVCKVNLTLTVIDTAASRTIMKINLAICCLAYGSKHPGGSPRCDRLVIQQARCVERVWNSHIGTDCTSWPGRQYSNEMLFHAATAYEDLQV